MAPADATTPVFDQIVQMTTDSMERSDLDPRSLMLIRLAALVAIGAPPASYRVNVALSADSGIGVEEIQGLLIAIAPVVGTARVVAAASDIARGLGVEVGSVDAAFWR